eukprot:COSAG06_NODE_60687_length_270_cov_0.602339_1_plen_84_part_10
MYSVEPIRCTICSHSHLYATCTSCTVLYCTVLYCTYAGTDCDAERPDYTVQRRRQQQQQQQQQQHVIIAQLASVAGVTRRGAGC